MSGFRGCPAATLGVLRAEDVCYAPLMCMWETSPNFRKYLIIKYLIVYF